jgi:hypothetical protein
VQHSYNQGNISVGTGNYYVGGVAGLLSGSTGSPTAALADSYNTGTLPSAVNVEPLWAFNDNNAAVTVTNCVYLYTNNTQDDLGATVTNVTGLSNSDMQTNAIGSTRLSGTYFSQSAVAPLYPILQWQTASSAVRAGYGPIYVSATAGSGTANGDIGNPFTDLNSALTAQTANSVYKSTIYLDIPIVDFVPVSPTTSINMPTIDSRIVRGIDVIGDLFTITNTSLTVTQGIIDGNSSAVQPKGALFDLNGSPNVATLTLGANVTLQNNNSLIDGGAIAVNNGTLTVNGSAIKNNESDGNGGGILINAGIANLNYGTISNNSATNGGGLFVGGGTVTVPIPSSPTAPSLTVSNNIATANGGGIGSVGTINIAGGTISDNSTPNGNGGVWVGGGSTELGANSTPSSGPTITNNSAVIGGGAYNAVGATLTISGATVGGVLGSGNSATTVGAGIANYGTFTMTSGVVSYNLMPVQYGNNGAGIYSAGTASQPASVSISGGSSSYNQGNAGAGLYLSYTKATLSGTASIDHNQVGNDGMGSGSGVYVIDTSYLQITDSASISSNVGQLGAGLYVYGASSTVDMEGGSVDHNTARGSGGGFYISTNGTVNQSGGVISYNTNGAYSNGAGVYIISGSTFSLSGTGTIDNNIGNTGTSGGGIAAMSGTLNLLGGTVSNNTAPSGAGVYSTISGATYNGVIITGNIATGNGGGIYASSTPTLTNVTITDNQAANGAGIYLVGSTTLNDGSVISGNIATGNGGGIWLSSNLTINGGTISGNSAANGAGIYDSGTLTLNTGTLGGTGVGNAASANGGGIYVVNGHLLYLNGGTFNGNTAVLGQGIYAESGTGVTYPIVMNPTATSVYSFTTANRIYLAGTSTTDMAEINLLVAIPTPPTYYLILELENPALDRVVVHTPDNSTAVASVAHFRQRGGQATLVNGSDIQYNGTTYEDDTEVEHNIESSQN